MWTLFSTSLSGGHIAILWKFVLAFVIVLPARYYYLHKVKGFFSICYDSTLTVIVQNSARWNSTLQIKYFCYCLSLGSIKSIINNIYVFLEILILLNQWNLFSSEYKQIRCKQTQAMLQFLRFHYMAGFSSDIFELSNDTLWQQEPRLEERILMTNIP